MAPDNSKSKKPKLTEEVLLGADLALLLREPASKSSSSGWKRSHLTQSSRSLHDGLAVKSTWDQDHNPFATVDLLIEELLVVASHEEPNLAAAGVACIDGLRQFLEAPPKQDLQLSSARFEVACKGARSAMQTFDLALDCVFAAKLSTMGAVAAAHSRAALSGGGFAGAKHEAVRVREHTQEVWEELSVMPCFARALNKAQRNAKLTTFLSADKKLDNTHMRAIDMDLIQDLQLWFLWLDGWLQKGGTDSCGLLPLVEWEGDAAPVRRRLADAAMRVLEEKSRLEAGKDRFAWHKNAVLSLAASDTFIFSGSADRNICVWAPEAPKEPVLHEPLTILSGQAGAITALAVSDGKLYSAASDGSLWCWRYNEPEESDIEDEHTDANDSDASASQEKPEKEPGPPVFEPEELFKQERGHLSCMAGDNEIKPPLPPEKEEEAEDDEDGFGDDNEEDGQPKARTPAPLSLPDRRHSAASGGSGSRPSSKEDAQARRSTIGGGAAATKGRPSVGGSGAAGTGPRRASKLFNAMAKIKGAMNIADMLAGAGPPPRMGRIYAGFSDTIVRVWDGEQHDLLAELSGHGGTVISILPMQLGQQLCTAARDDTVRIWDAQNWTCMSVLGLDENGVGELAVHSLVFCELRAANPEMYKMDHLCASSHEGPLELWNVQEKTCEHELEVEGETLSPTLALVSEGEHIYSGHFDGSVCGWTCNGWRRMTRLSSHSGTVRSLVISQGLSGKRLLFAGFRDGTLRRWKLDEFDA